MVKTPNIRHSKARRDPVTIDLDPAEVKREPTAGDAPATGTKPSRTEQSPKAKTGPQASAPADRSGSMDPATAAGAPGGRPDGESGAGSKAAEKSGAYDPKGPAVTAAAPPPAEGKGDAGTAAEQPSPAAPGPAKKPQNDTPEAATKPVFGREASGSSSVPSSGTSGPFRAAPSMPPTGDTRSGLGGDGGTPPARRGALSLVAAGIVGGVVVLVGAGILQYAGVLPAPGSSSDVGEPAGLAELRSELAALRDQVAAGGPGAGADPVQTARLEELSGALDQVRTDLAELRSAVSQGEGGDAAGLQALDQRMAELEARLASLGQAGGETVDLAPLTDRIGAVESEVAELARTAQTASDTVAGLPDRIAALDERMAAVDGRVSDLAARLEEQASNPRIALAIAAAGLKAAIDRGDPFMTELETYASIAPDAPGIAELRDLAASGVPTRAAISQAANAAANRMIAAAAPAADDTGFFGRLLDSMQSVVKVRPIGDVPGDDVGAIVARLEAAVRAGDYDRAITEYESLPEPAKQAGAGFIADVRARQSADTLVEQALAGALRPQEG